MSELEVSIEKLSAYTLEDAAGIGRFMPFLSDKLTGDPIPEALLIAIIESPYHEQLIARLDGIIVGSATLNILMGPAAGRVGYLEDFVTDAEVRGKGIGTKLWDEMIAWCESQQIALEFTSNPSRVNAHAFYRSRGAVVRDTTVFRVEQ